MAAKKAAKKSAKKPAAKKKAAAKKPSAAQKKPAAKKPVAAKKAAPKKKPAAKSAAPRAEKPKAPAAPASEAPAVQAAPAPVAPPPEPVDPGLPVHVGDEAPDFTLNADDGSSVTLRDLRGKMVVLYFYPRDNTPGCTIEARDFSQLQPEFASKNAIVLGVSTDDEESHRHFKDTCELSVKLLADPDKVAHQAYGTWRQKNMYGKTVWGTVRTTFLIGDDGRVAKIWPKVKVDDHALDVFNAL